VFRVGIAYLIVGWVLAQVADLVLDNISAPPWVMQAIMLVLGLGFLLVIFFSWAFEVTPEGIKRESEVDRSKSITNVTGRKLDRSITILVVVALAYFVWESRIADKSPESETGSEYVSEQIESPAAITGNEKGTQTPNEAEAVISRQSIAVLPFDNRSRLEGDEFFVEGIHDDLLTNLARIGSLKVISRTSVLRYKDTEIPIPEIATELGVATIMEGAVQRAGNTVRINVQLIDAQTDEHLWAEIFDRELTTDNLFAIQSEISKAIADALEATLTDQEKEQINRRPTDNLAAYSAFMLGRQLLPKRTSITLEQARNEFERAVKLDPGFALAWVGIANSAWLQSSYGTLGIDETAGIMETAINRALEIDPLLGEAHAAQGTLFDRQSKALQAENSYRRAIELSPNYASSYHWYANQLSGLPKRAREGLALITKAVELDPLSPIIRSSRGWIFQNLGKFDQAGAVYLKLIELYPDFPRTMQAMAYMNFRDLGNFDEAYKWSLKSQSLDAGNISYLYREYRALMEVGSIDLAAHTYRQMEDLNDKHWLFSIANIRTNIKNGQIAAAREQASFLSGSVSAPFARWISGSVFSIDEDYDRARKMMLSARPAYLDRDQWSRLLNENQQDACRVGWVLMRTGDETLGRDLLEQTIAYLDRTLPQYMEHADRYPSTLCHAALGDIDATLESLQSLVAHNHIANWWEYRSWPQMRLVLDDPRFVELDQKVTDELTRQRIVIEALAAEQGAGP